MNGIVRLIALCSICLSASLSYAGEVDVVDVKMHLNGDNHYPIAVTLQHGDTGWDHYANAWEVLDEDGTVIGERILHHPHVNEQPFTRSLRLSIPATIKEITVRGKDSVHGYGGKTMTLELP
jgi:hypothetical protein